MKLQFKEQDFQKQAVKAVVDCSAGQALKTNRFTLERSAELIRKAKQAASGGVQVRTKGIAHQSQHLSLVARAEVDVKQN